MFFAPIDTRLPVELLVIRMAAYVETEAEMQALRLAWRQCLQHGPTVRRTRRPKTTIDSGVTFTKESAGIPLQRLAGLERCLEVV
jgi:hypothetical protein